MMSRSIESAWVIEHGVFAEASMKPYPLYRYDYSAAGGDAAPRFNLQIKITLFKMELRVPLLFPCHLEVNSDEPWL